MQRFQAKRSLTSLPCLPAKDDGTIPWQSERSCGNIDGPTKFFTIGGVCQQTSTLARSRVEDAASRHEPGSQDRASRTRCQVAELVSIRLRSFIRPIFTPLAPIARERCSPCRRPCTRCRPRRFRTPEGFSQGERQQPHQCQFPARLSLLPV